MRRKLTHAALVLLLLIASPTLLQSQAVNEQTRLMVLAEMNSATSNAALITEWPLVQGILSFPTSLRQQLALSDADLNAALNSDNGAARARIRQQFAQALGLTEGGASVAVLVKLLQSAKVEQRQFAAFALWLVGDEGSLAGLSGALRDVDDPVRRYAALALGRILASQLIENRAAIASLTDALLHESKHVRREAARALAHAKGSATNTVPALIALYKTDESEYVRQQAVHALGHLGETSQAAAEALHRALRDPSDEVRSWAAHSLSDLEQKLALPSVETLLSMLQGDPAAKIRRSAAHTLGHLKAAAEKTTPSLLAALQDKDATVRGEAAFALSNLSASRRAVVPALIKLLQSDVSAEVRRQTAHALSHLAGTSPQAIAALRQATTNDPSTEVRREATAALVALRGE